MRTRVARHGKKYVFSDGELAPFSCKWYFEYLKTTESGKIKNKEKKNDFTKPLTFMAWSSEVRLLMTSGLNSEHCGRPRKRPNTSKFQNWLKFFNDVKNTTRAWYKILKSYQMPQIKAQWWIEQKRFGLVTSFLRFSDKHLTLIRRTKINIINLFSGITFAHSKSTTVI